jgi:hypothetical protein
MRPPAPVPARDPETSDRRAGERTRATAAEEGARKDARKGRSNGRGDADGAQGPTIYRRERSPARLAAIAGAVLVVVVLAIVLISSSGGSGGGKPNQSANTSSARHAGSASDNAAGTTSPASLHVVVLNATQTNGLAGKTASTLKGHGYTQAAALFGMPSGTYDTTVVEYAQGHRADAMGVARALGVSANQVRPLGSSTAPLSGGAPVVVVVGEARTNAAASESGHEAATNAEAESGGQAAPTEGAAGGETANGGEATPQSQAAEPGA